MKRTSVYALALIGMLFGSAETLLAADPRNAIKAEKAGRIFASICYDLYLNDVSSAQTAAQRAGFKYDSSTELFVHKKKDQQMRINGKRCALRFLTKTPTRELMVRFGGSAAKAAKVAIQGDIQVEIGTEDAGGGMTRAAAKLDLKR